MIHGRRIRIPRGDELGQNDAPADPPRTAVPVDSRRVSGRRRPASTRNAADDERGAASAEPSRLDTPNVGDRHRDGSRVSIRLTDQTVADDLRSPYAYLTSIRPSQPHVVLPGDRGPDASADVARLPAVAPGGEAENGEQERKGPVRHRTLRVWGPTAPVRVSAPEVDAEILPGVRSAVQRLPRASP